ncbi:putative histidine kinase [Helianthus annuus]|nr:putative histidine kinase [Helianthus annuus]
MELEEKPFDLVKVLESVVDLFYPVGIKKEVDVILDLFTFTFVFFRSDLEPVLSSTVLPLAATTAFNPVVFFFGITNAGIEPSPTSLLFESIDWRMKVSQRQKRQKQLRRLRCG